MDATTPQLAVTPNELTSGAGDRNLDIKAGLYGLHNPLGISSTLAQNQEPDHDEDTKEINEGDVTIDSDVHYNHQGGIKLLTSPHPRPFEQILY